jgi:hypothetical protein
LITLQEQIDTVTVEGVENVGEEDWVEIKTEEDYIELVGKVKCEQEVSVLCFVLVICVQVHVHVFFFVHCVFNTHFPYLHITSFQFLPVNQQLYLCDTFHLIAVCPDYCVLCLGSQYQNALRRSGDKGQQLKDAKQLRVSKYYLFIFIFNIMKVMLSNKCYDNSQYPAISTFLWLVLPKTYHGYVKLLIIPNIICNVLSV